ncbi:hypothetical protein ES703_33634 [subsurface metagenome]
MGGFWVYSVLVDSKDDIFFTLKNLDESHPTDASAKIMSLRTMNLTMDREQPYMISYVVEKWYVAIQDSKTDYLHPESAICFYRIKGFAGTVAPYQVDLKVYDNAGRLINEDSELGVAGDPSKVTWTTPHFKLGISPEVVNIYNVGQIAAGMGVPVVDLVVDYRSGGTHKVFTWSDYWTKLGHFQDMRKRQLWGGWDYSDLWNYLDTLTSPGGIDLVMPTAVKGVPISFSSIELTTPSDTQLWSKLKNSEYYDLAGALNSRTKSTGKQVISLQTNYTSALIQLRVSTEIVDSWVWRPPNGIPQIQPINDYEAYGGKEFTAKVGVRNVGTTSDTFVVSALGSGVGQLFVTPPEAKIGPSSTEYFYVTFGVEDVGAETSRYVTVKATAMGSRKTDERTFKLTIKPSPNGDDGFGSVKGAVIDSVTKNPVVGAYVSVGSGSDTTNSVGVFFVEGIDAGNPTLYASHRDYRGFDMSVSISANVTTNVGTIELIPLGVKPWWEEYMLYIILAVALVVMSIVVAVLWRRRG